MKSIYELLFCEDYENKYPGWGKELWKRNSNIKNLSLIIDKINKRYYPLEKDLFKSLEMVNLKDIKVVIWGQDPYPQIKSNGKPRAQGYSFGVSKDDEIPGSLKNIYKEIKNNFSNFKIPIHGDLTWLSNQGILFMNSSLTYFPEEPKLGLNIWNRFRNIIIDIINENCPDCIHVLWGNNAKELENEIKSKHIITGAHPSPLSSYRFFGCRHFLMINIILARLGKKQINFNEDEKLEKTFVDLNKIDIKDYTIPSNLKDINNLEIPTSALKKIFISGLYMEYIFETLKKKLDNSKASIFIKFKDDDGNEENIKLNSIKKNITSENKEKELIKLIKKKVQYKEKKIKLIFGDKNLIKFIS